MSLQSIFDAMFNLRELAEEMVKAELRLDVASAIEEVGAFKARAESEVLGKVRAEISDPVLAEVVCTIIGAELDKIIDDGVDRGADLIWGVVEKINPKDTPSPAPDLTPDGG